MSTLRREPALVLPLRGASAGHNQSFFSCAQNDSLMSDRLSAYRAALAV